MAAGDVRLACHLADFAGWAAPDDPAIHADRATIYEQRRKNANSPNTLWARRGLNPGPPPCRGGGFLSFGTLKPIGVSTRQSTKHLVSIDRNSYGHKIVRLVLKNMVLHSLFGPTLVALKQLRSAKIFGGLSNSEAERQTLGNPRPPRTHWC